MSALFNLGARSSVREKTTTLPDQPLYLPYEMRSEMTWLDFSGTANPLGTPKSFLRAMHSALVDGELCYNPDREARSLCTVLSRYFGLSIDSFICGCSVSDMVRAAAQTYQACTVGVAAPLPAEYILALSNAGHTVVEISHTEAFVVPDANTARKQGFSFDAMLLANPTYPTSRLLPQSTLENYLNICKWVIVDESLIELTLGGETMLGLVKKHQNLIVIRSLSSTFAMPGVPISYCGAHPETIASMKNFFDRSTISMFAEVLAEIAFQEKEYLDKTHEFLETEIPWMQCMLNLIPGIRIYPAEANFVMCSFENGNALDLAVADTPELIARLQLAGYLVRSLEGVPGIKGSKYFCVAVRSREDNEKLLAVLRDIVIRKP